MADLVAFPKPGDPAGLWGVIHPGACGGKTPPRRVPLFKKVLSGPATIRGRVPAHAARGLAFASSPSCRPPRQACETTEKGGMITEHTQACGRTEVRMPHTPLGPRPCRVYQNVRSHATTSSPLSSLRWQLRRCRGTGVHHRGPCRKAHADACHQARTKRFLKATWPRLGPL